MPTPCTTAGCGGLASLYGSGPYLRRDYCLSCYQDWFRSVSLQEDVASGKLTPQKHGGPLPAELATPVWRQGKNVVVRQKACDRCGVLIHIRKNAKGRHYPADTGGPTPHRCGLAL